MMIPYYEEALNTLVMKLAMIGRHSSPEFITSFSRFNKALKLAYDDHQASGINFAEAKELIAFKWALICIAVEVEKTSKHDALLAEMHFAPTDKKNLIASDLYCRFATDTINLCASSVIPEQTKIDALSDLHRHQLYADLVMQYFGEHYESSKPIINDFFKSIGEQFAVKLLHADVTMFDEGIKQATQPFDVEIVDLGAFRNKCTDNFWAGKALLDDTLAEKALNSRVDRQHVMAALLAYQPWQKSTILLDIFTVKEDPPIKFAELVAFLVDKMPGIPGHNSGGQLPAFTHCSDIDFLLSSDLGKPRRFAGNLIALENTYSKYRNTPSQLFKDLTPDHMDKLYWLVRSIANRCSEGSQNNMSLYFDLIKKMAQSHRPNKLEVPLNVLFHNFDGHQQKVEIYTELLDVLGTKKPQLPVELHDFIEYVFSHLRSYSMVMEDGAPYVIYDGDDNTPMTPDSVLAKYVRSVDAIVDRITSLIQVENIADVDVQELCRVIIKMAQETDSLEIGKYLVASVIQHTNKIHLGSVSVAQTLDEPPAALTY